MGEEEIQVPIVAEKPSLARTVIKNSIWNFASSLIMKIGALVFTIIIARILQPEL